ncbi:MAG: C-GCAxxG-C-C family protein [Nitrospirota bacterium]
MEEKDDTTTYPQKAVACVRQGFGCSQALIIAYGGKLGVDNDLTIKISSVFGRGMGVGGTCGAVTGALMLIGAKYGNLTAEDLTSAEKAVGTACDFINDFIARHGSVDCKELIHCDVNTTEGFKHALDTGIFANICSGFVRDAAEILEKYLRTERAATE